MCDMGSVPRKKSDRPTLEILGALLETHHLFFSALSPASGLLFCGSLLIHAQIGFCPPQICNISLAVWAVLALTYLMYLFPIIGLP